MSSSSLPAEIRAWFENRLFDWFVRRLYPVNVARTPREREAVYRFRHEIYLREQNERDHPELDEARGWIHGPADDDPATTIYYLGRPERILGTVRVRVWAPGEVPEDVRRLHSVDLLPGADERTIGDIKMLMLRPDLRGAAAAPSMLVNALLDATRGRPVDMWFAVGAPGLVQHYRALGFDPHGGRFAVLDRGIAVSLLGLAGDLEELRRRGSPIYTALRRMPQSGLPAGTLRAVIAGERSVSLNPATLREAVRRASGEPGHVLEGLSEPALDAVARAAILLELQDGERLIHEGFIGKELYVVLDGSVVTSREGRFLSTRGAGDVIGDVAFLESGYRTADCFASGRTRLLALRPSVLRRLERWRADHDLFRERLLQAREAASL